MSKHKLQQKKSVDVSRGNRTVPRPERGLSAYLVSVILILGCFVLLQPLVIDYQLYSPPVFLKSILFRTTVQLMVFLYIALALISPVHRPRFHRITYALLAWFGVMLFCSLPGISSNAWKSWWGNFARMDGMFSQLHLLAYFFVLVQTFKKERDWLILFSSSLMSGMLMGFMGLIESLGVDLVLRYNPQSTRIEGATGNPDFFGSYMLLNAVVGLYLLARRDRKELYPFLAKTWFVLLIVADAMLIIWASTVDGQALSSGPVFFSLLFFGGALNGVILLWYFLCRRAWAGTIFLSVVCLYDLFWIGRSQTRAAAAGIAGALAIMATLYVWRGKSKPLKIAAAILIVLFAAGLFTTLGSRDTGWVRNNALISRLASTSLKERRFIAWEAGLAGMSDRPVWGWGLEQYSKPFSLHAPERVFRGLAAESWDDRAHNIILDIGTTTGLIGLAAFLTFYGLIFAFLFRTWFRDPKKREYLLLIGVLSAYLTHSLFTFDTVNTNGILFLILAYFAYLFGQENSHPAVSSVPVRRWSSLSWRDYSILAVTAGILVCAFHFLVREPFHSNAALSAAMAWGKTGSSAANTPAYVFSEPALYEFQRADEYRTTGKYEVREELANYVTEVVRSSSASVQEKAKAVRWAADFLQKSILEDSLESRHYMYAATFTNAVFPVMLQLDPSLARNLAEKNIQLLKRAEKLGPNRPRLYTERAQSLLYLGRTAPAIDALKKAVSIDPKDKAMRVDLVTTCISGGLYADAESEWKNLKASNLNLPLDKADYQKVIDTYVSRNQIPPVIPMYKEMLQAAPEDPILLARLATAYRESGDMTSARETALKAGALSPQIAAQLQEFLKTLKQKPKN